MLRRALPANVHHGTLPTELELKAVLGAEPLDVGLDRGVEVPVVRRAPADLPQAQQGPLGLRAVRDLRHDEVLLLRIHVVRHRGLRGMRGLHGLGDRVVQALRILVEEVRERPRVHDGVRATFHQRLGCPIWNDARHELVSGHGPYGIGITGVCKGHHGVQVEKANKQTHEFLGI